MSEQKTLKQLLVDKCEKEGWDIDDESLVEALRECFPVVWEGGDSQHRWRIDYSCVCQIGDRFFEYTSCKGTNENSWEDAGYNFEGIDKVVEVRPVEVTVTEYKPL